MVIELKNLQVTLRSNIAMVAYIETKSLLFYILGTKANIYGRTISSTLQALPNELDPESNEAFEKLNLAGVIVKVAEITISGYSQQNQQLNSKTTVGLSTNVHCSKISQDAGTMEQKFGLPLVSKFQTGCHSQALKQYMEGNDSDTTSTSLDRVSSSNPKGQSWHPPRIPAPNTQA
ncbi:hypothetical protein BGX26_003796 [Mortierella sp. AD094]|nr:hypothetical protein BGX26_003796 [Mortierella sp. AD094]